MEISKSCTFTAFLNWMPIIFLSNQPTYWRRRFSLYIYIVKVSASWYTLVFLCSWLHPKIPPKPRWVLQSRWRRMEWKVGISKVTRIWSLHLNFLLKGLSTNWSKIWIQVMNKAGLLFLWAMETPPLFLVSLILPKMLCFTPSDLLNLMASPKILVFFKLGGT